MRAGKTVVAGAVLAACLATSRADAANLGGVEIHGFGGSATGYTGNGNRFGGTAADGFELGNAYFSLNLSAGTSGDTLSFNAQVFGASALGARDATVDYAFAQWAPSSKLQLRAGKVKSPFGLYTEIYDVGTLRPFYLLPQAMYSGPGLVSKSYLGGGATGNFQLGGRWELDYDAVVGEMVFDEFGVEVPVAFDARTRRPVFAPVQFQPSSQWLAGARVSFVTPVEGLSFGGSYMNFDVRTSRDGAEPIVNPDTPRHDLFMVHLEYLTDAIWLRAEGLGVGGAGFEATEIRAAYAELAWRFLDDWQVGASWERYDNRTLRIGQRAADPATLAHEAVGLALNYWLRRSVVLKLNYYRIDGAVFARPEARNEAITNGTLDSTTDAVVFGVQFSF